MFVYGVRTFYESFIDFFPLDNQIGCLFDTDVFTEGSKRE